MNMQPMPAKYPSGLAGYSRLLMQDVESCQKSCRNGRKNSQGGRTPNHARAHSYIRPSACLATVTNMAEFNPETVQAIGCYVYALIDPRRGNRHPQRFFYVGKGIGQRCFAHAAAEVKWKRGGELNPKLNLIRQIRNATGAPPPIQILAHRLPDAESHRLEAILIGTLQTDCNIASGKNAADYNLSVSELEGRYSNPLRESELGYRVLLVSLNGGEDLAPFPEIQNKDLPRRVLKYWPLSDENADSVEYIIRVYQQLTRCVFKVDQNPDCGAVHERMITGKKSNGQPKWKQAFQGERCLALELKWANRRILASDGQLLTKFERRTGARLVGKHSKR